MDFQWSGLLVVLLLVPALVALYAWSLRRRRPAGVRYSSLALIRDAQPGSSRLRRHLPFALFVLALTSLVVGLAGLAAAGRDVRRAHAARHVDGQDDRR